MYEENIVSTEGASTAGVIQELTQQAKANNETAENISQRLQDLRLRLIGPTDLDGQKESLDSPVPTPVRAEIEVLGDALERARRIQEEILSNLVQLERL